MCAPCRPEAVTPGPPARPPLGDDGFPSGGDGRCCSNHQAYGNYPCYRGVSPHTVQYMGSLHPRVKQLVGQRLAQAARTLLGLPPRELNSRRAGPFAASRIEARLISIVRGT